MDIIMRAAKATNISLCYKYSVHGELPIMNERCARKGFLLHVMRSNFGRVFGIFSSIPLMYNVETQYVYANITFLFSVNNASDVLILPGTSPAITQHTKGIVIDDAFIVNHPLSYQSSVPLSTSFSSNLPTYQEFQASVHGLLSSIFVYGSNGSNQYVQLLIHNT